MKKNELIFLLAILAIDLISKLMANAWLPFQETVPVVNDVLVFHLVYESETIGGFTENMDQADVYRNQALVLNSYLAFILVSAFLYFKSVWNGPKRKKTMGFVVLGLLIAGYAVLEYVFTQIPVSTWVASVVVKGVGTYFWVAMFRLTQHKFARYALMCILASGLGNLLSYFYSPYQILEFIYFEGSHELYDGGVLNIADIYFNIGMAGLIGFGVFLVFNRVTGNHKKPTVPIKAEE
ncbi:MAG TPA: signal peptidase II [Catalimonadaceae bacterium]|nr:signal peptidase II [Catalimonadaceae bacterium]